MRATRSKVCRQRYRAARQSVRIASLLLSGPDASDPTLCPASHSREKLTETFLINRAHRQFEHSLRCRFLAGREPVSIQLEKQNTDDEARALVAITEGAITRDGSRIHGSKLDDVRTRIGDMMQRSGKRGLKQRLVS